MKAVPTRALAGATVVITRPAGHGGALARRVRAMGGTPLLLPGLSLHPAESMAPVRRALREALAGDGVIYTSPAAVHFAARLLPLVSQAQVFTVGAGSAAALRRHGVGNVQVPEGSQDSEGLLDLPALRDIRGRRFALVGAPGGRGILARVLAERGAQLAQVHVYQRGPPRLDRRHHEALAALHGRCYVLLSSGEALAHLHQQLPATAWVQLCRCTAVVSSERLLRMARQAGFADPQPAASAVAADLLQAVVRLQALAQGASPL